MNFSQVISEELKLEEWRVAKALELMDQGGTVPFIARYRKDQTGTLDEIELRDIQHRREYLQEIQERKETILKSIEEQGKLTPELKATIEACKEKTLLEDLYAPYKPKKRTRATVAKELGLEPLARTIIAQEETSNTAEEIGRIYLSEEMGLADPKAAINGACDILAEELADNATYRQYLRAQVEKLGVMTSKVKKEFEKQIAEIKEKIHNLDLEFNSLSFIAVFRKKSITKSKEELNVQLNKISKKTKTIGEIRAEKMEMFFPKHNGGNPPRAEANTAQGTNEKDTNNEQPAKLPF